MDKAITPAQIRAIHVALHRRGIEDDDYRQILRDGWNVDTCKRLTRRQASELLRRLGAPRKERRTPGRRRRPALPDNVTPLATAAQRRLIDDLAAEIEWREPGGYARWLKGNMGLKRVSTSEQAAHVIEGLKGLKRHA